VEDLCERFGDRNIMDIVKEFNKLRQEGTVQNYQLRFEELKLLMIKQATENAKLQELTVDALIK